MLQMISAFKTKLYHQRRHKFITNTFRQIRKLYQQHHQPYQQHRTQYDSKQSNKANKLCPKDQYFQPQQTPTRIKNNPVSDLCNEYCNSESTYCSQHSQQKNHQKIIHNIIDIVNYHIEKASTLNNDNNDIDQYEMYQQLAILFKQLANNEINLKNGVQNKKIIEYIDNINKIIKKCYNQSGNQQQQHQQIYKSAQQQQLSQETEIHSSKIYNISHIYVYFITSFIQNYLMPIYANNNNLISQSTVEKMYKNILYTLYTISQLNVQLLNQLIYCQLLTLINIIYENKNTQQLSKKIIWNLLNKLIEDMQSNIQYYNSGRRKDSYEYTDLNKIYLTSTNSPELLQFDAKYQLIQSILFHVDIEMLQEFVNMGYLQKIISGVDGINGSEYLRLSEIMVQRLKKQGKSEELLRIVQKIWNQYQQQITLSEQEITKE